MEYHKPGDIIKDRYEIVEILGEGAFGAVYRVKDKTLHEKEWAMKELGCDFDSEEDKKVSFATFQQESKILSNLKHPGIPDIADYFIDNERAYLIMEVIQGKNLDDYLESRKLPLNEDEIYEITGKLCEILRYLHTLNPPVIFRDLKPSNIMMDDSGKLSLIDFGIARVFSEREGNRYPSPGNRRICFSRTIWQQRGNRRTLGFIFPGSVDVFHCYRQRPR